METKSLIEQFHDAKPDALKLKLTDKQQEKAAYLAKRIHQDANCTKEEAARVGVEYVLKFGTA